MNMFRKKQAGVSLLEIMLVLAIGGSLLVLGFRQYQVYKMDSDLRRVLYNVDELAVAASLYYYANCGDQRDPSSGIMPGRLSPRHAPPPNVNFSLNINSDLVSLGYLKANAILQNPLVNNTAPGGGYSVQLNQMSSIRTVTTCSTPGCTPQPVQIGTAIDWKIQIGVTFNNATVASMAQAYLQASCLSTKNINTNSVVTCNDISGFTSNCITLRLSGSPGATASANANGCPNSTSVSDYTNFIVFERSPHFPVNMPEEGLWGIRGETRHYYREQTSYPLTYLLTNSHNPEYQYFLCGT